MVSAAKQIHGPTAYVTHLYNKDKKKGSRPDSVLQFQLSSSSNERRKGLWGKRLLKNKKKKITVLASKLLPSARPRCTPPDTNGESSQTWLGWSCNTPEGRNLHLHFRSTDCLWCQKQDENDSKPGLPITGTAHQSSVHPAFLNHHHATVSTVKINYILSYTLKLPPRFPIIPSDKTEPNR